MILKDILNRGTRFLPLVALTLGYENWKMNKEAKIASIEMERKLQVQQLLWNKIHVNQ